MSETVKGEVKNRYWVLRLNSKFLSFSAPPPLRFLTAEVTEKAQRTQRNPHTKKKPQIPSA